MKNILNLHDYSICWNENYKKLINYMIIMCESVGQATTICM
jgi:hypothetical protein